MDPYIVEGLKRHEARFAVILTKHCNLKCRGCSAFSNISEPCFYDYENLKKDLKKISDVCNVTGISFLGGEPLLYPKLKDVLIYTRKLLPHAGLTIFTNGKDLVKLNMWKLLRALNICIIYTKYTDSKIDYEAISKKARIYGMQCLNINECECKITTMEQKDKFFLFRLSKNVSSECIQSKADKCPMNCVEMWDSKIFLCLHTALIDTLNNKFSEKFLWRDGDYLEIQNLTSDKYFNFISSPTPFCEYCFNEEPIQIPWSTQKAKQEDFIIPYKRVE